MNLQKQANRNANKVNRIPQQITCIPFTTSIEKNKEKKTTKLCLDKGT